MAKRSQRTLVLLAGIPGGLLVLLGLFADQYTGQANGFGGEQVLLVSVGALLILFGWLAVRTNPRLVKKACFASIIGLFTLLLVEVVASTVQLFVGATTDTFWVFEESGRTFHFDPIRGYRLTPLPSRVARVTHGRVEYLGVYRGNEQGFPDKDDFTIRKPNDVQQRFLVLGDSFSAAQFNHRNWPDSIEMLTDDRWQLLNFSTDGGGLANWWNNYVHLVEAEDYEYDQVIFAVSAGDLRRRFSLAEHRNYQRHMFGRVPHWDTAKLPQTAAEARQYLRPSRGYILDTKAFTAAVRDKRLQPTRRGLEHLWLTSLIDRWLRIMLTPVERGPPGDLQPGQLALIADFRERLQQHQVRPIVVHIPSRGEVLTGRVNPWKAETETFAELLGAEFIDGSQAFAGVNPLVLQQEWYPFDGHWAQGGSDRFAKYLLGVLEKRIGPVGDAAANAAP
ncbi:MAG: hypothetical protein CL681_00650 [Blastopirellula sp.]|nr:hypothetical protein [Blastopirellula sp.]